MKKVLPQKLVLSKETLARLEACELTKVGAGIWTIDVAVCTSSECGPEH